MYLVLLLVLLCLFYVKGIQHIWLSWYYYQFSETYFVMFITGTILKTAQENQWHSKKSFFVFYIFNLTIMNYLCRFWTEDSFTIDEQVKCISFILCIFKIISILKLNFLRLMHMTLAWIITYFNPISTFKRFLLALKPHLRWHSSTLYDVLF